MSNRPSVVFKIWVTLLSVLFAALLFPNIVERHGVGMSLLYTAMGIGCIWLFYFIICWVLDRLVSEEIKKRDLIPRENQEHRTSD